MNLTDIVRRSPVPQPWSEGDNIPWNEPGFSARMLKEHLSQEHDAASRRAGRIDAHVDWIHAALLGRQAGRVLDMGCGPGLYASRLAALGHTVTGIDFSPASIEYARAQRSPGCTYHLGDLREADFGQGYDLAMLIFGELNVFRPEDARLILRKAYAALKPGGTLLLEPHLFQANRDQGHEPPSWFSSEGGLFSDHPHIVLVDSHWDEDARAATQRYYVIDAASGEVERFAASYQAYSEDEYRQLLESCGFTGARFYPALGRSDGEPDPSLMALTARKNA